MLKKTGSEDPENVQKTRFEEDSNCCKKLTRKFSGTFWDDDEDENTPPPPKRQRILGFTEQQRQLEQNDWPERGAEGRIRLSKVKSRLIESFEKTNLLRSCLLGSLYRDMIQQLEKARQKLVFRTKREKQQIKNKLSSDLKQSRRLFALYYPN